AGSRLVSTLLARPATPMRRDESRRGRHECLRHNQAHPFPSIVAVGILCAAVLAGQSELPREVLLLQRIREHMKARLAQVPNYTCLEPVERFEQVSNAAKFKPVDTVRIEVAEVDGKELYARPGKKFDETNPAALAKGGFMANGLFALHAKALFIH